ncbi:hypothetical protein THAOC_14919, partial [Thalassiosira oceanica]
MKRQRIARSGHAGFTNRRFSNGYLRPAESQVNSKYVQMDVEALNDGLSPNIHRSMAIRGSIAFRRADPKHYLKQAYGNHQAGRSTSDGQRGRQRAPRLPPGGPLEPVVGRPERLNGGLRDPTRFVLNARV